MQHFSQEVLVTDETVRAARHASADLIALFEKIFFASEGTRLVRGEGEPSYAPRDEHTPFDQVIFAHGFFASGLHETAHWCVAGRERRRLPDFGYWYKPDGRSAAEQREFERVEVKPQALEWIFSKAAGTEFHFSADNLAAGGVDVAAWRAFQENVARQARHYVIAGLPARAERFAAALAEEYASGDGWRDPSQYEI